MTLSKSDYMLFLRHPAWIWLKKYDKYKLPPIDDNLQALFDAGHEFETYAEKLYPNAVKLGFSDYNSYKELPNKTKKALDDGASAILQGRFEEDGLTCIIDILDRVGDSTFDLIEIKSSTKAKVEHNYDLAFQTVVLEKPGIKVRNISIIHVDNEYIRKGEIEPDKLTAKTDVTDAVKSLADLTTEQIDRAFAVLTQRTMPDLSPRYVNQIEVPRTTWFADWLEIYKHLNPNLNSYSIYFLGYPNAKQIGELENNDVTLIRDIPEKLALRPKQIAQIKTTKSNERIIKPCRETYYFWPNSA